MSPDVSVVERLRRAGLAYSSTHRGELMLGFLAGIYRTPYLLELQALLARLERTQLDHGSASREHLHRVMLLLIDRPWRRR